MPLDQLGLSFLPSGDANGQRNDAGPTGGGRLEDVLRILSLRLPKVLGAHAIAPGELLNSPGGAQLPSGGGHGGDPIADTIVNHVLQNMPQLGGGSAGGSANPAGSFTPNVPGAGLPGGTAGPNPGEAPAPTTYKPRIIPEDPGTGGISDALDQIERQLRRHLPKENPNMANPQNY